MSNLEKEQSGLELLRPLAKKLLNANDNRDRVWSDELEAWGFFANRREKIDDFLIWCCAGVGDRFALGSRSNIWSIGVVLEIKRDPDPNRPYWRMKLFTQHGKTLEFEIQESILFQSGWNTIGF